MGMRDLPCGQPRTNTCIAKKKKKKKLSAPWQRWPLQTDSGEVCHAGVRLDVIVGLVSLSLQYIEILFLLCEHLVLLFNFDPPAPICLFFLLLDCMQDHVSREVLRCFH